MTAFKIGPLDFVVKLVVFYAHERFWQWYGPHPAIYKVALWKILAVAMTTATTIIMTGRLDLALKLGPSDFFCKLFLYCAHDQLWFSLAKLRKQRNPKKEY